MDNLLRHTASGLSNTETYTLSIRLASDGFSFSLSNPQQGEPILGYYEEKITPSLTPYSHLLREALQRQQLLAHPFKHTYLLWQHNHFLLVPPHYSVQEGEALYRHYMTDAAEVELLTNKLPLARAKSCFEIDRALYQWITTHYPSVTILHHLSPLCEYCCQKSLEATHNQLFALLHRNQLDIIVCGAGGTLQLANTFTIATTHDAAYYILNTWQQLELLPYQDTIYIGGSEIARTPLIALLQRYVVQVNPLPLHAVYDGYRLPYDLTTLPLCEL